MTINDTFQFGALVGKVEVDLLNKDDDNYRRQVLHSEKMNNHTFYLSQTPQTVSV